MCSGFQLFGERDCRKGVVMVSQLSFVYMFYLYNFCWPCLTGSDVVLRIIIEYA